MYPCYVLSFDFTRLHTYIYTFWDIINTLDHKCLAMVQPENIV